MKSIQPPSSSGALPPEDFRVRLDRALASFAESARWLRASGSSGTSMSGDRAARSQDCGENDPSERDPDEEEAATTA